MSAWLPLCANLAVALLGVAQSADWVNLLGSSQAGVVTAVVAGLNVVAHVFAGAGPGVAQPTKATG